MARSADVPCPPLTIDKYATPQMWQITVPNIPKITAIEKEENFFDTEHNNAIAIKPIIYPPDLPDTTPSPPVSDANTGTPIIPSSTYVL